MTQVVIDPSIVDQDLRDSPNYLKLINLFKETNDDRLNHFFNKRLEEIKQVINLLDQQLLEPHSLMNHSLEQMLERIDLAMLIINNREAKMNILPLQNPSYIEFNLFDRLRIFCLKHIVA
jgi:hypothetical protein